MKLKWTNHCVLARNGDENTNASPNKDTKLYVPVVTLSANNNQKLSKLLRKGFGRSVYWYEHKTKIKMKNTTNEYRYFLESNFVGVNRLFFFWFIEIKMTMLKGIKPKDITSQKVSLRILISSSMERN